MLVADAVQAEARRRVPQEAARLRDVERIHAVEYAEENILHHILGLGAILQEGVAATVDHRGVCPVKSRKFLLVRRILAFHTFVTPREVKSVTTKLEKIGFCYRARENPIR